MAFKYSLWQIIHNWTWSKIRHISFAYLFAGLDAQQSREGGTWFGMSIKYRRIGTLLNILTSGLSPDKKPRGQLVVDYLVTNADTQTYLNGIAQERQLYNSFNLVLLENMLASHYLCSDTVFYPVTRAWLNCFILVFSLLSYASTVVNWIKYFNHFDWIIKSVANFS